MRGLARICIVLLLFWLEIAASVDNDTECTECFLFGPSRKTQVTLYYYPRDLEDATQTCLDMGGWLFVDYTVVKLDNWITIVTDLWEPILKEKITILSGGRTLKRANGTQEFEWQDQMCEPELLEGHTDESRYWANVEMLSEFSDGRHTGLVTFWQESANKMMSFICAKEIDGCTFSELEDTAYDGEFLSAELLHLNVPECLAKCQLMEDTDSGEQCWLVEYDNALELCSLYLVSVSIVSANQTIAKEGQTLYVKECYEPFVNFEKVPVTNHSGEVVDGDLVFEDDTPGDLAADELVPKDDTPGDLAADELVPKDDSLEETVNSDETQPPREMFPLKKYCDIEPPEDPYNGCPPGMEYEDTGFSVDAETLRSVETTTEVIQPTPSSSFDLTSSVSLDDNIVTSSYIDEEKLKHTFVTEELFTTEPSIAMTSAIFTPAEIPETTPFPLKQTTTDVMTSVEPTPALEMTSVYQTNSTEISMLTKTSIANVTATMDATECDCTCIIHVTSTRDPQDFMSSIIHDLEIDKKNTSRNRRRYRSMNLDHRWQTLSVGYLGVAMFFIIFGGIVLMDMGTLVQDFRMMLHNIRERWLPGHGHSDEDTTPTTPEPETPRIDLRDVDKYSALAAEVCPKPIMYRRPQRPGERPTWSNRERYDPYVGFRRGNIYNSN